MDATNYIKFKNIICNASVGKNTQIENRKREKEKA